MIIDTHAHLNFAEYDNDRDRVVENSLKEGIFVINVGTNFFSSEKSVQIAESYPTSVYAAIGLHPENIQYKSEKPKSRSDKPENVVESDFDADKYAKLAESPKVVAVGEIGLDYLRLPKTEKIAQEIKEKQRDIFLKQLSFARERDLPIIIHCRMAHAEMIEILKKESGLRGVIHCFTGSVSELEKYLNLGFYIGLDGIIFKMNLDEAIKKIPPERILLETDCPYLTPPPLTGRNEPRNVRLVAQRVAQIRNVLAETIIEFSFANARKLFKI